MVRESEYYKRRLNRTIQENELTYNKAMAHVNLERDVNHKLDLVVLSDTDTTIASTKVTNKFRWNDDTSTASCATTKS